VRTIDNKAIKAHADRRFRSEYDYALFEYHRSAKVFAFLDNSGVKPVGRILDAGCGGGGMPLSLAEESSSVVAIDLVDRFRDAGTRLATEMNISNLEFLQADGTALPFAKGAFDCVLSHAVIEHVADAEKYLQECRRVLKPGGWMYLSTAPYLSFAGAHLPRLKVPVPLHLLLGRKIAFNIFRGLSRHATWTLREQAEQNSFIKAARANGSKHDDLLELVRVQRLRGQIARAGFSVIREELHLTGTFRNLPGPIPGFLRNSTLTQDIVIGNMEYVLKHGQ
jgi:2-polyprenyl-3-methyl-5-hydroxy-6-metoxy-1,4-benzoquinol methylase